MPGPPESLLAASDWPEPGASRVRRGRPRRPLGRVIAAVTELRRYREQAGAKPSAILPARLAADGYEHTAAHVARLARLELAGPDSDGAEAVARGAGARRRRAAAGRRRVRPRRGRQAHRRAAGQARRGDRPAGGQAGQRAVRGARAGRRWWRASGRSSTSTARSWRGWADDPPRGRGLPAGPRAVRHALRPRPHAQAHDRARDAPAPLRLDPRGGLQRQVLHGALHRRAARAPRPAHRQLHLAAPAARSASGSRSAGVPIVARSASPRRWRAPSTRRRWWSAPWPTTTA